MLLWKLGLSLPVSDGRGQIDQLITKLCKMPKVTSDSPSVTSVVGSQ